MALTTIEFIAYMLDGTELECRCVHADLVAWDRHRAKFSLPKPDEAGFIWTGFMCWHVLHREGRWDGNLGSFEAAVRGIESATTGPNGDGVTEVDPTNEVAELA